MDTMFHIVALGNPGEKYTHTRHNIGWLALDHCVHAWQLPQAVESSGLSGCITEGVVAGKEVSVLYPSMFMNNSGSAVVKLVSATEVQQLIVVHDDIDIPFGKLQIAKGRGAGGHNGVASIIQKLGTNDFIRVRIGIAPKSFWTGKVQRPAGGGPLERFVLRPFTSGEQKQLPAVFAAVQKAIETILIDGEAAAMNQWNVK